MKNPPYLSTASRESSHQTGTDDAETRSLGINETATESLRRTKFSSAPDMHKVESTSPGELRGAGLLSCFPSFKTGANKSKQYKLVVRSPNGSTDSPMNFGRKLSRFLFVDS